MTQVRILRLAAGGDGVRELPWEEPSSCPAPPGDLVELGPIREHPRFARGQVGRLLEPSPLAGSSPLPVG